MLNDYDQRQYQRMIEAIDDYRRNKLSLPSLVSTLEGLIGALEGISATQRNDLLSRWGVLEEVYAVSLDQGIPEIELVHAETIARGLQNLRSLVEEQCGTGKPLRPSN